MCTREFKIRAPPRFELNRTRRRTRLPSTGAECASHTVDTMQIPVQGGVRTQTVAHCNRFRAGAGNRGVSYTVKPIASGFWMTGGPQRRSGSSPASVAAPGAARSSSMPNKFRPSRLHETHRTCSACFHALESYKCRAYLFTHTLGSTWNARATIWQDKLSFLRARSYPFSVALICPDAHVKGMQSKACVRHGVSASMLSLSRLQIRLSRQTKRIGKSAGAWLRLFTASRTSILSNGVDRPEQWNLLLEQARRSLRQIANVSSCQTREPIFLCGWG